MLKQILIAFMVGALLTGAALGTFGYAQYKTMNEENTRLATVIKKQAWRLDNLTQNQSRLEAELSGIKDEKNKSYDQTIGALMQAKDNASIDALYTMGIKALNEKDAPRAYFALAQVVQANPEYKAIADYYPKAESAYQQHQEKLTHDKLSATYALAFDQQAKGQFAQAKANYAAVVNLKPDFKDAKARLLVVSRHLSVRTQTRELEQKKQWLEAAYKLGFNHQANGRYADAKSAYQQIVNDSPAYKDAAQRLKAVVAKLPKTPPPVAVQASDPVAIAAQNQACYNKGKILGSCAQDPNGPGCGSPEMSVTPAECKNNPEFTKGYQSTATRDPNGMLKGLSSLLKNL